MKLQKLLYYAQGHYLARHNAPLFAGDIQAWSHGPVVPPVYRAFKDFGASTIVLEDSDSFDWQDVDDATAEFLGKVWNTYGGYSAGRLRSMTHNELPWQMSWRGNDERDAVIDPAEMTSYFRHFEAVR